MARVPMTVAGEKALREELDHLKTVLRPRIVHDIAVARAHGDLKENAEYHAARDEQGFCEGRIQEIEGKLAESQVIDITKLPVSDKAIFGTTVDLLDPETEKVVTYKLVGDDEADVKSGKISINSPIARAVIGKEIGDEVIVKAPSGDILYEIDDVKYI